MRRGAWLQLRRVLWSLCVPVVACACSLRAAEWRVATNGLASGNGSAERPWDIQSALSGRQTVRPGDTIWISGGAYRFPNRSSGSMGFEVSLAGETGKPIIVRADRDARVTIDGGMAIREPSSHLWVRDLEILVSENLSQTRRFEEPGSHPKSYNRPWGGLNIYSGHGCKFINLIIHDNAQGVSWWRGSTESELYGCIIYDNGWEAPDRGHGHAVYTQNDEGLKTVADCIMAGGYGHTMHAYGSSRADVNNYLMTGNICYDGGRFLIGGGKPSHSIRVLTNFLHGVSMQLGYSAPYNVDCEVRENIIADGELVISKFRQTITNGNVVLKANAPRPGGADVTLRPNRYDASRGHVVVYNWEKLPEVTVSVEGFLEPGQEYELREPRKFFDEPLLRARCEGASISVQVPGEFQAFVLMKRNAE